MVGRAPFFIHAIFLRLKFEAVFLLFAEDVRSSGSVVYWCVVPLNA